MAFNVSRGKVICSPIDFASLFSTIGESSIALTLKYNSTPHLPSASLSSCRENFFNSFTILTPFWFNFSSVLGPIPGISLIGNGSKNSSDSLSFIITNPSGFFIPAEIFAISLFGPIPIEQVTFNFFFISFFIFWQIWIASSVAPLSPRNDDKKEIKEKLKVTCSIGIGPNKLIAKISAGMKKPDGLVMIKEKESEEFLEPLPIREIPGIGPKTEEKLNQ